MVDAQPLTRGSQEILVEIEKCRETIKWAEGYPMQRNPWAHRERLKDLLREYDRAVRNGR